MGLTNFILECEKDNEQLKNDINYYKNFNKRLKEENQLLKKQLEEKENIACNWKDSCLENAGKIEKLENQQKEFIEYINEKIDICDGFIDTTRSDLEEISYRGRSCGKTYIANEIMKNEGAKNILEEILSKYKEIIGVSDEK